jgi:hypothetical protein
MKHLIKKLINLANYLDKLNFTQEADQLTNVAKNLQENKQQQFTADKYQEILKGFYKD